MNRRPLRGEHGQLSSNYLLIAIVASIALIAVIGCVIPFTNSDTSSANPEMSGSCGDDIIWTIDSKGNLLISGTGHMTQFTRDQVRWGGNTVRSVTFEGQIDNISSYAFKGCTYLKEITIPDSVHTINNEAFTGCTSLTSVTLGDSIRYIDGLAFSGCISLTSVTFNENVITVDISAFMDCTSLKSISLPASVMEVGQNAFRGCTSLESIVVNESNTKYSSEGGILFDKDKTIVICCPVSNPSTTIVLPDTVTTIHTSAFEGCTNLESIVIPDLATSIGQYAFHGCTSLESVVIPDSVNEIKPLAFWGCSSLREVIISDSLTSIGSFVFSSCTSLESIVIPNSVKEIGSSSFSGCTALKSIALSDQLTSIGSYAFRGCSSLESIDVPDSVITLGDFAFQDCTSLLNIRLSESITSIQRDTFNNCASLRTIVIPDSVTSIEGGAFSGCGMLYSLTIGRSVSNIDSTAFYQSYSIFEIVNLSGLDITYGSGIGFSAKNIVTSIDDSTLELVDDKFVCGTGNGGAYLVRYIGTEISVSLPELICGSNYSIFNYAFKNCNTITTVSIPDTVTTIGDYAFYGCSSLNSISIPKNVSGGRYVDCFGNCSSLSSFAVDADSDWFSTEDGVLFNREKTRLLQYPAGKLDTEYTVPDSVQYVVNNAFEGSRYLEVVTVPATVTELHQFVFKGCESLRTVELSCSLTNISAGMFEECTSLVSVNIPDSVMYIGSDAFRGCTSLSTIEIPDSVISIGTRAFQDCSSLTSINIPDSVTSMALSAFWGCTKLSSVTLSNSLATIDEQMFWDCSSLTSIVIPESVSSIGSSAFLGCVSLFEVTNLSNDLTLTLGSRDNGGVAQYAMNICTSIEQQTVSALDGKFVYGINDGTTYLLKYLGSETSVVLPDLINGKEYEIYHDAFNGCSHVSSITIPESVISIGDSAFVGCTSLVSVTYPCHKMCLHKGSTDYGSIALYATELNPQHTLIGYDMLDATCISDGHSAYYTCYYCDYSENYVLYPALGHDYSAIFDWALDGKACTITLVCGNDSNHDLMVSDIATSSSVKIPATCTAMGTTTYTVSFTYDGFVYTDSLDVQDIPAIGHDYGATFSWANDGSVCTVTLTCCNDVAHVEIFSDVTATSSVKIPATCTAMGTTTYSVSVTYDGVTYSDSKDITDISASGHSYVSVMTEPTCTESGYTTHTCSVCQHVYIDAYTDPIGHDYSAAFAWSDDGKNCTVTLTCGNDGMHVVSFADVMARPIVKIPATCTAKGTTTYAVSVTYEGTVYSDYKDVQDIPAIGHNYSVVYTWANDGSVCTVTLTCMNDDSHVEIFSDVAATPSVKVPATCTVMGTTTHTVSVTHEGVTYTSYKDVQDIPANGHSYVDSVTAPTCTAEGFTTHVCSICQHTYIDAYTDAIGHDYSAAYVWSADGKKCTVTLTCGNDGTHTVSFTDVAAQPSVKIPATCTAKGTTTYTVSVTYEGTTYSDSKDVPDIPANGHSYKDTVTLPTSTEQGYTTHVCSVCQDTYVDGYVEPLGDHQYATYDWSADMKTCTVTIVCVNDPEHSHTIVADVTSAVKTEPTSTMMGTTAYSVSVTYDGLVYSASRDIQDITALEPEYEVEQTGNETVYSNTVAENQTTHVTEIFNTAKTNSGSVEVAVSTSATDSPVTISFDSDAVNSIGGNEVSLTASVTEDSTAVAGAEMVIEVSLQGATFSDGKAKVTVPLSGPVPAGKTVKVYFINGNERTDMNATVSEGKVVFETNHFSTYAIVFEDEPASEFPIMFAVIGAVAILAVAGVAFIVVRRRA